MLKLAESHVLSINPYIPSRPYEEQLSQVTVAELASNENCLGPSPLALKAAKQALENAHRYPNAQRYEAIHQISKFHADFDIGPRNIALGNGTSELIVNLVRGLTAAHEAVLIVSPTFVMYRLAALAHGRHIINSQVDENMRYVLADIVEKAHNKEPQVKMIFLANPNNPTGDYINKETMYEFIHSLPHDCVLVIDEAYFEYVKNSDYSSCIKYIKKRPRTVVLRTLSKAYGLAGLRFGYALADEEIIDILSRINDPFNVNAIAQAAAIAALDDHEHLKKSIAHNQEFIPALSLGLAKAGFKIYPSVANFVLAKCSSNMPEPKNLCPMLAKHGVSVRNMYDFGLINHIRVSVGTQSELMQLFNGLEQII